MSKDTQQSRGPTGKVLHLAHTRCDTPDPVGAIAHDLGAGPFAAILMFVCPRAPLSSFLSDMTARYPDSQVVACTTAGEISPYGYTSGEIVCVGLPRSHFAAHSILIPDLSQIDSHALISEMIRTRTHLLREQNNLIHEFAFLAVDGLSQREDELMSALAPGLGPMPLFGGSAGDGAAFELTHVGLNGQVYQNAAVLCVIRTNCPVRAFSLDHFHPTDTRMVVTKADTNRRMVQEINAEPAAWEYARILGKDPDKLDSFTFAAHPVVVRIADKHHVRSIQQITENGEMIFFSAIGEGMVLSLAKPDDLSEHLDQELSAIANAGPLEGIIACDCVFRRIEAEQSQQNRLVSDILQKNRVIGFATYGEQMGATHVNQTITGIAIYAPES